MAEAYDIEGMAAKIQALRRTAEELRELSGGLPAVACNVDRILSNVRVLEIDISDLAGLG